MAHGQGVRGEVAIPSGTPPERAAEADEDDDGGEVPATAGLPEESSEERRAARRSFFPSSMGLAFLVPGDADSLTVAVHWGDHEIEGEPGKAITAWRRRPATR